MSGRANIFRNVRGEEVIYEGSAELHVEHDIHIRQYGPDENDMLTVRIECDTCKGECILWVEVET